MLWVQGIDPLITADEIIDFISEKMTLQHRKEAQHQDRGGERNWQPRDVRQMDAEVAEPATPVKQDKPKGSGSVSHASGGKPQSPYPEVKVQAVDAILAEVYGVQSTSQAYATRKRKEPRPWGMPRLSFREYREKHGGPDSNGGCYVWYGQNRDHRHDHTRCELNKREKAQYLQRHPDKEVAVIPANIVRSTPTGSATLSSWWRSKRCRTRSPPITRRDLLGPRPREAPVATSLHNRGSHARQIRRTPLSHLQLCAKQHWMWMKPLQCSIHDPRSTACPTGSERS